jgi:hypothetical protein
MMLRYAHLLQQTLLGVRTEAAVEVGSGKCEVKDGLMNFLVIFTFILLEGRQTGFEAMVLK